MSIAPTGCIFPGEFEPGAGSVPPALTVVPEGQTPEASEALQYPDVDFGDFDIHRLVEGSSSALVISPDTRLRRAAEIIAEADPEHSSHLASSEHRRAVAQFRTKFFMTRVIVKGVPHKRTDVVDEARAFTEVGQQLRAANHPVIQFLDLFERRQIIEDSLLPAGKFEELRRGLITISVWDILKANYTAQIKTFKASRV